MRVRVFCVAQWPLWAARRSFTNNLELPKFLDKSLHKLPFNFGLCLCDQVEACRFWAGRSSAFQNFKL